MKDTRVEYREMKLSLFQGSKIGSKKIKTEFPDGVAA